MKADLQHAFQLAYRLFYGFGELYALRTGASSEDCKIWNASTAIKIIN